MDEQLRDDSQALNDAYASKDFDSFYRLAYPKALAASKEALLVLHSSQKKAVLNQQTCFDSGLPWSDCVLEHQRSLDNWYAYQEAQDVAQDVLLGFWSMQHELKNPDRVWALLKKRCKWAARDAFKEVNGHKDRGGRLDREVRWFTNRYAINSFLDEDTNEQVSEAYEPGQDPYSQLEQEEEVQMVRDSLLQGHESWSEILHKFYVEEVPASELQQEYHLGQSSFYERLSKARAELQANLSTHAYV